MEKVFSLIVDNTSGVLSRISGLFSRRGYNIESITAGVTADPRFTRITIVTTGDDDILEQIEKQVEKLVDVRNITELVPDSSVYRELALIKIECKPEERPNIISITDTDAFKANVVDISKNGMIIEMTATSAKIDSFLELMSSYKILEIARTGIAGLHRGTDNIFWPDKNNIE